MSTEAALAGGAIAVLAGGGMLAHAVRGRSSEFFGPSVYRGSRERGSLALTFDDGPSESTPELLDILARHGARATFFMCGSNVERLPEIARRVAEEGHEIGNHSDTHAFFQFRSEDFLLGELSRAQEKIQQHTGVQPVLFRPPYGVRWFGLASVQQRLKLLGVMWSVLGRDWRWPAPRIARLLETSAGPGDIVCLHDGRTIRQSPDIDATLQAVDLALPALRQRGLKFETVSELLCRVK